MKNTIEKISNHKDLFSILSVMIIGIVWLHMEIKDIKIDLTHQAQRTDRLYEMFIDLLKEKK